MSDDLRAAAQAVSDMWTDGPAIFDSEEWEEFERLLRALLAVLAQTRPVREVAAEHGIPVKDNGLPIDVVRPAPFADDYQPAPPLDSQPVDMTDYMAGYRQAMSDALAEVERIDCSCPPWIEDSPRARHRVHEQGCRTAYITEAIRCLIGEEATDE